MPSVERPDVIPVDQVNNLEWLSLEALWSTLKSPFPVQWNRWLRNLPVEDPTTVTGLVIGGNLGRARLGIEQADTFTNPSDRLVVLSHAAEHIGKLAGGLINTTTHLLTPSEEWTAPYAKLIPLHIEIAADILRRSDEATPSLSSADYYDAYELPPTPLSLDDLDMLAETTRGLAENATATWVEFLDRHGDLAIQPGGTPRSAGPTTEALQITFAEHMPLIQEELARYTTA